MLEAVRQIVEAERGGRDGSMPWTSRFLDQADRQSGGRWRRMELTSDEASRIVLPPHEGEPCRGDRLRLVPPGGATVAKTAAALSAMREDYAHANRECWGRIAHAAATPFSTIVLTTSPLDLVGYDSITPAVDGLYHLDGFHRLVGWAWAGRLLPDVTIQAIVAETMG